MISVALAAAIVLVGAIAILAIDWERIRERVHRPALTRDYDLVLLGLIVASAFVVLFFFVGLYTVGVWLWEIA